MKVGSSSLNVATFQELQFNSELYTLPQLETHAQTLAAGHRCARKGGNNLLARLRENEQILRETYELLSAAAARKERVSPAAEWLLDNFYLIEKQITTVRRHLPRGYSRELPRLTSGTLADYPRVYSIAYELISHVDGKVDRQNIQQFVSAYQGVATLNLGELWAIPIMLRLAIIENLRNVAIKISHSQVEQTSATAWTQRFLKATEVKATDIILTLADMSRAQAQLSSTFVAEFSRQMQAHGQNFSLVHSWIEQRLLEQGTTRDQIVHEENQRQASNQISIENCIESLRALDSIDWREFVDLSSNVEHILLNDPLGVYFKMDFATRDHYRHVIERLARKTELTESAIAQAAIDCANETLPVPEENFKKHVGYYLVDDGVKQLEVRLLKRPLGLAEFKRKIHRMALLGYTGSVLLITLAFCALAPVAWHGLSRPMLAVLATALAVTASQLAVSLTNWLSTRAATPNRLPRLDFSNGIAPEFKSVVAVPCMIATKGGIDQQLEKLEIRYLGNRDRSLTFALLSDFKDANAENVDGDAELVSYASQGIEALNKKHGAGAASIFYLFHRPRKWNAKEKRWMGYERKRGKLAEFNHFLLTGKREYFSQVVGDPEALRDVQFVITLDADTQLPADSAQKLIGTLAHPLNRPIYNAKKRRVTRGYTILQPTAAITLPSAQSSLFSSLYGGEPGIDPYTQLVSDVNQDLFGEGSFIGKGIYDVKAFERTLSGVLPENRILSHDLLEGSYVRCGLATDIRIYEDFPSRYLADTARRHRWMRGDWQVARWLMPLVPALSGSHLPNPISLTSKWKIFDNLRRSLVPICFVVALIAGWAVLANPRAWTLYLLLIPVIPPVLDVIFSLFSTESNSGVFLSRLKNDVARIVLNISFLPYEAWVATDAIVRTLFRLFVTGARLLEWTTSSEAERAVSNSLGSTIATMWAAPLLSVAVIAAGIYFNHTESLRAAVPLLLLWFLSPGLALAISVSARKKTAALTSADVSFLRLTARQTWAFFDRFVNADENWLPPDNFQEQPIGIIAHRTSPTNMGMSLLANLAAFDLGYIAAPDVLERCRGTLNTLGSLERSHGHFYNWYDTLTLKPLNPLYISTVDSGNLAGHLLTLERGLLEIPDLPIIGPHTLDGIADSLRALENALWKSADREAAKPALSAIADMRTKLEASPRTPQATVQFLKQAKDALGRLNLNPATISGDNEINWLTQLTRQIDGWLDAVAKYCPFVTDAAAASFKDSDLTFRNIAQGKFSQVANAEELSYRSQVILRDLENLADVSNHMATAMDFAFLYIESKKLFSIGFNVTNHRLDSSCYDLLASEARLASFVAIALGQVDQEHWFALGRQVTVSAGNSTLVSWSGSMFEYLMPLLVMPTFEGTLLDQTYTGVVRRQIAYGKKRRVPWGISESGYNLTDAHLNYQYRAFGVPGLGLQRGLGEDLVIAPYATQMALMVSPEEACENLRVLSTEERVGAFGFYEAVDYTPSRLPRNQKSITVKSYMAHHQGMGLLALDYALCGKPMQRRFAKEPIFKVAELLLHERVPKTLSPILPHPAETTQAAAKDTEPENTLRVVTDPNATVPEVHLISNGRYHVMANSAGSGNSRWKDLAVTRWREDVACDTFGLFCYIKDVETGAVWSNSYQPTLTRHENYEAIFSEGRIEYRRRDHNIELHTEISVSAEDDVEIRRIHIVNHSNVPRTLELTSYGEVVIANAAAEAAHPAFSNLFVQTKIDTARESIIGARRPRVTGDPIPGLFHSLWVRRGEIGRPSYETDRSLFIGRGRSLHQPAAMQDGPLSGSSGSVLDPIVAIRRTVRILPRESVSVDLICGMGETEKDSIALLEKYRDEHLADRVFDMAWTHAQVALRQLNCSDSDAQLYSKLAGSIIYATQHRRASAAVIAKNRRNQSGLWAYGISGDVPIVMLRISDVANIELVRQCIQAHAFWRMKGLIVDLVLTNDDPSVYRQALYDQIVGLIAAGSSAPLLDKSGGIFVRRAEQISEEDRILMQSVARVVLSDSEGSFKEQVEKKIRSELTVPAMRPSTRKVLRAELVPSPRQSEMNFFNGLGGFNKDGTEYVIMLDGKKPTPAPWVNVIANPTFGTVVSESGSAYTWLENSHEFRLTPWKNDPVTDSSGEAVYLRDDETGLYWSPTPLPSSGPSSYLVRHGFGYSTFETCVDGIATEMVIYVALDAPVKFMRMKIKNKSNRARKLSAFGYFEWVLAELRSKSMMHISTEQDARSGSLIARNPYSTEFPGRLAFVASSIRPVSWTGDRSEFVGRNGTLKDPAALSRLRLSGKTGAGLDPCAAIQVPINLAPDETLDVVFELGIGQSIGDVQNLLARFGRVEGADQALTAVKEFWKETLTGIRVETADTHVDLLANGWLLYQTLCSRMWARTGFYQSGGAFGFRDQLQDSMALLYSHPALARQHLLLAARHQFPEGDVQHWWHAPSGRGVRTHFSDDFLWLPFAACHYAKVTGDTGIFDEPIPYVEGRPLNADEESYYDMPMKSEQSGSLYQHCMRAIEHGLHFGAHGLPLMGCGDWNDGMNRVGIHGKGESVWLAFFLYDVLMQFAQTALGRGDTAFQARCLSEAATLKQNIEANAWDGNWYRRAYFDDGRPLGSESDPECKIDSLPQSWSVISGAGDEERSKRAMACVNERLIKRDEKLILLFNPPFNNSDLEPGYIKGYVPGVRENGGQYTHAALWVILGLAKMGHHKTAWELLAMVNPIGHAETPEETDRYKVEPYVVAADVYGVQPHVGRGGWTWYTGSAGWMYRVIIETLMGFHLNNDVLELKPCVPDEWKSFKLQYRFWDTKYEFLIENDPASVETLFTEGSIVIKDKIKLVNDGAEHRIRVRLSFAGTEHAAQLTAPASEKLS